MRCGAPRRDGTIATSGDSRTPSRSAGAAAAEPSDARVRGDGVSGCGRLTYGAPVKIFVDADACPAAVKEIVIRAAERLGVSAIFVANKNIRLPASRHVSTVRVGMGLDVADGYIAKAAEAGDLAVTADIPLAAALVARGAVVLDLRGTVYTDENVGEALALRDFHHELREGGVVTGGPAGFGPREARAFAGAFDRELTKAMRRGTGAGQP
jgi:hypothetical protein